MVAMFLPPAEQYVNAHPFCFHLYEVEAEHGDKRSPYAVPAMKNLLADFEKFDRNNPGGLEPF